MDKLIYNNRQYSLYEYDSEAEFEKDVVKLAEYIFGKNSVYLNIKKLISNQNVATIPDGYLIDFAFADDPMLYVVENELTTHDPYKHIGQQLLKFAVSYKAAGREIKKFLMDELETDKEQLGKINGYLKQSRYRNIDSFLEDIIFNKKLRVLVVIDSESEDLDNVISQLSLTTGVLELKKYTGGENEVIYQYSELHDEIIAEPASNHSARLDASDSDTMVVPANEDGFVRAFMNQNCWYAVRISPALLDKIKHIAAYQTAPISAITYVADVDKIEKYQSTGKYIIHFKEAARKIGPLKLVKGGSVKAPQGPRYTSFEKLSAAKDLEGVF